MALLCRALPDYPGGRLSIFKCRSRKMACSIRPAWCFSLPVHTMLGPALIGVWLAAFIGATQAVGSQFFALQFRVLWPVLVRHRPISALFSARFRAFVPAVRLDGRKMPVAHQIFEMDHSAICLTLWFLLTPILTLFGGLKCLRCGTGIRFAARVFIAFVCALRCHAPRFN